MARKNEDQDIHDRHPGPEGEFADEGSQDNPKAPAEPKAGPYKNTPQKVRDAHFKEDGVRADGTVPSEE